MSLSSVVTAGYLPDAGASLPQVTLFGYSNGAEPPPIPPTPPDEAAPSFYGPALTPAMRRRWFGDEERERTFDSPLTREARRQARERLARIEIGLLPPDPSPEDREEAAEVIETIVEQKIAKAPAPRSRLDAAQLAEKVAKAVKAEADTLKAKRAQMEADWKEEEAEALAILSGMLFKD